jgi:hypothetical protein
VDADVVEHEGDGAPVDGGHGFADPLKGSSC